MATPWHESPVVRLEARIGSLKPVIGANISDGVHVWVLHYRVGTMTEVAAK